MYQSHFRLHDRPFAFAPDPEHYYPAASIEQAREVVALNVERASGATLVMGAVGTGKTLLCELIANQFANELPVCSIPGGRISTPTSLLQTTLHALGLPFRGQDEGELRFTLTDHLSGQSCRDGILLIIDEADRLSIELLEEIRVLTNIVKDGEQRVRLVLAGEHRLEERVGDPRLESLNQRVVGRLFLSNFTVDETADYVRARLKACGGDADSIFTEEALQAAHRATSGVPRLVNQTCDHAMLLASVANLDQLDMEAIEEAWADLQQLPMPVRQSDVPGRQAASDGIIEFAALDDEDSQPESGQLDALQRTVSELESDLNQAVSGIGTDGSNEIDEELFELSEEPFISPLYGEDAAQLAEAASHTATDDEAEDALSLRLETETQVVPSEEVEAAEEITISEGDSSVVELTIDQATSPFDEEFDDEEVVIQEFASPSKFSRDGYEHVTSSYSRHLAEQLTAAHPGLRMHPASDDLAEGGDESDERNTSAFEEEPFQPLSAFMMDDDYQSMDDDFSEQGTAADDSVQFFREDNFDPSQDPILPEPSTEVFNPGVQVAMASGSPNEPAPPRFAVGVDTDIAIVVQENAGIQVEDPILPDYAEQMVWVEENPTHGPVGEQDELRGANRGERPDEPSTQPKKFRTLFSSMRR